MGHGRRLLLHLLVQPEVSSAAGQEGDTDVKWGRRDSVAAVRVTGSSRVVSLCSPHPRCRLSRRRRHHPPAGAKQHTAQELESPWGNLAGVEVAAHGHEGRLQASKRVRVRQPPRLPTPPPPRPALAFRAEKDMAAASAFQLPGKLLLGIKLTRAVQEGASGKSCGLGRPPAPSASYPVKLV